MKAEDVINIAKGLEALKPEGFSEIKIVKSPFIKDGNPILLVSDNDFKQFKEKVQTTNGEWIAP